MKDRLTTLLITLALIVSHATVVLVAQGILMSEGSYEGYKEGSEYMIDKCYDLIDYSRGHAPTLSQ